MLLVSTDSFFIRRADFDSWTVAFVFGIASTVALSIAFGFTSREPARAAFARCPVPIVGVAVLSAATQICFTAAVNHTAVANVVVIVAATPVVAAVLAWLVLRERTDPQVTVAIAVAVGGIVLVVSGSIGDPTLDGDLLAVAAIVLFSFSILIWRRHPDMNRPLALAASSAVMAATTAPFAAVGDAPARVFVAAGLMGLVFNPLGRISYSSAVRYAPTAEVALFTPIETVAATAWAWIFFAEQPSMRTIAGGLVVVGAVFLGTFARRPTRTR